MAGLKSQLLINGTQLVSHGDFAFPQSLGNIPIVQTLGGEQRAILLASGQLIELVGKICLFLGKTFFVERQQKSSLR